MDNRNERMTKENYKGLAKGQEGERVEDTSKGRAVVHRGI